jgi:hypothetical protein
MCRQVLCSITADDRVVRRQQPPVNNGPPPGEQHPANNGRLHQERDPGRFQTVAQRNYIAHAFRVVGLGHYLIPGESGNPPVAALIMFEGDLHWSYFETARLAPLARVALTTRPTTQPEGAITIDAESLGTSLLIMGNAIMRSAAIANREWSNANKEAWEQTVTAI